MPSAFDAVWSGLQGNFDATFGEPVRIEPQAGSARRTRYVAGAADPGIQPRDVVGIFRGETVIARQMGAGANSQENPDVVANQTTIDFDAAIFASDPVPQEGWMLTLTDRVTPNRYRVAAVKPDRTARVWCVVTGPL